MTDQARVIATTNSRIIIIIIITSLWYISS